MGQNRCYLRSLLRINYVLSTKYDGSTRRTPMPQLTFSYSAALTDAITESMAYRLNA